MRFFIKLTKLNKLKSHLTNNWEASSDPRAQSISINSDKEKFGGFASRRYLRKVAKIKEGTEVYYAYFVDGSRHSLVLCVPKNKANWQRPSSLDGYLTTNGKALKLVLKK